MLRKHEIQTSGDIHFPFTPISQWVKCPVSHLWNKPKMRLSRQTISKGLRLQNYEKKMNYQSFAIKIVSLQTNFDIVF